MIYNMKFDWFDGLVVAVVLSLTLLVGCGTSGLVKTMSEEGYSKIEVEKVRGKRATRIRGERTPSSTFWESK